MHGTFIYKVLPIDRELVSISSDDSLRVIDPHSLQWSSTDTLGQLHHGVTCLEAWRDRSVLTAGRDGIVKGTDVRSKRNIFGLSQGPESPLLSLACHGNLIAAGTELRNSQALVIVWDSRATSQPLLQYVESHSDDVTELAFHPSQPSCLLSGSTDGLVNLYDTTITDEDDALIQVFNHGSSIAHADFLSDHEVFALSHDEIFSIYDLKDSPGGDTIVNIWTLCLSAVRHLGHWKFQKRCISQADTERKSFGRCAPVMMWVSPVASNIRLPYTTQEKTIFTAGEDGQIKAWRPNGEGNNATKIEEVPPEDKKRKKHKSGDDHERARFKPY
ncbi:MAG: hypothetical protein L6R37_003023 [Teloschistes peruensis]|nr:MAG: hypothetical protein L6R37_003023 [Teloschistes peruensis]